MLKQLARLMILMAFAGLASGVSASPFIYTMTGQVAGSFNGVPYSTAGFVITGYADTDDDLIEFFSCSQDVASSPICADVRATVEIEGKGTFDILDDLMIWRSNSDGGAVGFTSKTQLRDIVSLAAEPSFLGWNLFTSLGPINGDGKMGSKTLPTSGGPWVIGGFGGESRPVVFQARLDAPSVSVILVDGDIQECSDTNGANVELEADIYLAEGDPVQSIDWEVNGTHVAQGDSVNVFVPLGADNIIDVYVMTVSGTTLSDTTTITIEDTVGPNITLAFVDPKSGAELSQAQHARLLLATYQATDTCDPTPTVTATTGAGTSSGDAIRPKVSKKNGGVTVTIEASDSPNLQLTVGAEDLSGNESEETISIPVIE